MPLKNEEVQAINDALADWRQGDVVLDSDMEFLHVADLSRPHSPSSIQLAEKIENIEAGPTPVVDRETSGMVVLTQTCDIVRDCLERPFIEVAPLIKMPEQFVEEVRRLKRPAFAYVPKVASDGLIADLDRTMTVEKAVITGWTRKQGLETDKEVRDFALALGRKRSRFAFPNDFLKAARRFHRHIVNKHKKRGTEGDHLRALLEIRVHAEPSWNGTEVQLDWWFIKDDGPEDFEADWPKFLEKWRGLFEETGRFHCNSFKACNLREISAHDYIESNFLDFDSLSAP